MTQALFLVLLGFCSCGQKPYPQSLIAADSLILPVLHFYIEKDDERHLPEAYYYAGRVYRDLGDAPQALEYFEKAVETLPEDGGYKLKSKIYSQMGTLFAYQSMYAEALEMYKKGGEFDSILKDSVGMVFKSRDIGNMYRDLGKRDSTLAYFKEASRKRGQCQIPERQRAEHSEHQAEKERASFCLF